MSNSDSKKKLNSQYYQNMNKLSLEIKEEKNNEKKENNSNSENSFQILKKKRKRKDEDFSNEKYINNNIKLNAGSHEDLENNINIKINELNDYDNIEDKKELKNNIENNIDINKDDKDDEDDAKYSKNKIEILKNNLCQVNCDNGKNGNGFFCNIHFPNISNLLPVLIIDNYILDKNDTLIGKTINIKMSNNNSSSYTIFIDKERKIYLNDKKYNITIIEIKKNDGLNIKSFLEIDKSIYNNNLNEIYKNKQIYLAFNEFENYINYFFGKIQSINEHNIICLCIFEEDYSGGPIILENNKLIGIHKGYNPINNYNFGIFIKSIIEDFNKEQNNYESKKNINININMNELEVKEISKSNQKNNNNNFFNEEKIIFKYEINDKRIDSVFVYKNGDILIFLNTNSILFDGKTFKPILNLDFIGCLYCFSYLSEDEFISFKENYFQIYCYQNNRTSIKLKQEIICERITRINKLENDDLAILVFYEYSSILKIFRKEKKFVKYSDSNNYSLFMTINDYINDFIEFNPREIFEIRKKENTNELVMKILNSNNYALIRENTIKTIVNGKTSIFISSSIYKGNEFKVLALGFKKLYIFDTITLEVETFIKLGFEVNKMLCLNDDYFLFNYEIREDNIKKFIVKKIKINFLFNEIVDEITEQLNNYNVEYSSLFKLEKYINGGIITIINDSLLRIYK